MKITDEMSLVIYAQKKKKLVMVKFNSEKTASSSFYRADVSALGYFEKLEDEDVYFSETSVLAKGSMECLSNNDHQEIATFTVDVNHVRKHIELGPSGNVGMLPEDFQNCGIGSYCLKKIFKQMLPLNESYTFREGALSYTDAKTDEKKENRNNFYRGLGFELVFNTDPNERDGYFRIENVNQLNTKLTKDKITEITANRIYELFYKNKKLMSLNKGYAENSKVNQNILENIIKERLRYKTLFFCLLISNIFALYFFMKGA